MKKNFILFLLLAFVNVVDAYTLNSNPAGASPTSVGIVIYSNDTETVWNAMRLANYSKNQGDTVSIFLLGKGVELDDLVKTDSTMKEQTDKFLRTGGIILGCGTCLTSRKKNEPEVCKFSSLKDLYELIRRNKIVLTF